MTTTSIVWLTVIALVLSVWATVGATKDDSLTKLQRRHQIVLAWALPVMGGALLIAVRHFMSRPIDRSSGDSSLVVKDHHYISKGYFF
jgi:hypothetical protein